MAYDLTWTFSLNQTPADQTSNLTLSKSFMLQLKNFLVANGWSVVQSSNAVAADATDNWTTLADIVFATSGARSWVLLASPIGFVAGAVGDYLGAQSQVHICLECISSTAGKYYQMTAYVAAAPPAGTTSAIPTGGQSTGQAQFNDDVASWSRFHFGINEKGGWYALWSYDGSTRICSMSQCLNLVDVGLYGAIPYPYAFSYSVLYSASLQGMGAAAFDGVGNTYTKGFNHLGVAVQHRVMWMYSPWTGLNLGAWIGPTGDTAGQFPKTYFYVVADAVGSYAHIGRVPDILLCGTNAVTTGALLGPVGEQYVNANFLWLPANAGLIT